MKINEKIITIRQHKEINLYILVYSNPCKNASHIRLNIVITFLIMKRKFKHRWSIIPPI